MRSRWLLFLWVSCFAIDQIYVINLDRRPEKFAMTKEKLAKYGVVAKRFSAVDGQKVIVKGVSPRLSRGGVGVILSHLGVLRDAQKKKYRAIWVMEDDVEILRDPTEMERVMEEIAAYDSKWDVIYTDWETKNRQGKYVPCLSVPEHPKKTFHPLAWYQKLNRKITENFSRCGPRFGTYSIVISKNGVARILRHYRKYGIYGAYDCEMPFIEGIRLYRLNRDVVSTIPDAISDN